MSDRRIALDDGSLVDLLDRLLETGVVLDGSVLITLAGVDLVRLDLRALLASVETLKPDTGADARLEIDPEPTAARDVARQPAGGGTTVGDEGGSEQGGPIAHGDATAAPASADRNPATGPGSAVSRLADRDTGQPGLAGLVVALVDIVRQLLERQAIRRMEAGSLDAVQIERLGRALRGLQEQTTELVAALGLRTGSAEGALAGMAKPARPSE